jgi:hypothetical protein
MADSESNSDWLRRAQRAEFEKLLRQALSAQDVLLYDASGKAIRKDSDLFIIGNIEARRYAHQFLDDVLDKLPLHSSASSEVLNQHQVGFVSVVLHKIDEFLVLGNGDACARGTRTAAGSETDIFELATRFQSHHPEAGHSVPANIIETVPCKSPLGSKNSWCNQVGLSAACWYSPNSAGIVIK